MPHSPKEAAKKSFLERVMDRKSKYKAPMAKKTGKQDGRKLRKGSMDKGSSKHKGY
jgi:hypothetical protein